MIKLCVTPFSGPSFCWHSLVYKTVMLHLCMLSRHVQFTYALFYAYLLHFMWSQSLNPYSLWSLITFLLFQCQRPKGPFTFRNNWSGGVMAFLFSNPTDSSCHKIYWLSHFLSLSMFKGCSSLCVSQLKSASLQSSYWEILLLQTIYCTQGNCPSQFPYHVATLYSCVWRAQMTIVTLSVEHPLSKPWLWFAW